MASEYNGFDYAIQGVGLTDMRWNGMPGAPMDGVWHMTNDTEVLPHYGGVQVTEFNVPGGHGERQVQHAPMEPRNIKIVMRFMAYDANPASSTYMQMGRSRDERLAFIEANINEFFFRTRLGAQGSMGNVRITRTNPHFEHFPDHANQDYQDPTGGTQMVVGRFLASMQADRDADCRWAEYEMTFRDPNGCWYSDWQYWRYGELGSPLSANTNHTLEVPMGTAPVNDALIAVDPMGTASTYTKFTNDSGLGFEVRRDLHASQWSVFDTLNWRYGYSPNEDGWDYWDVEKPYPHMLEFGRPLGTALLITPGIAGSGAMVGRVHYRSRNDCRVHIAIRPKWF